MGTRLASLLRRLNGRAQGTIAGHPPHETAVRRHGGHRREHTHGLRVRLLKAASHRHDRRSSPFRHRPELAASPRRRETRAAYGPRAVRVQGTIRAPQAALASLCGVLPRAASSRLIRQAPILPASGPAASVHSSARPSRGAKSGVLALSPCDTEQLHAAVSHRAALEVSAALPNRSRRGGIIERFWHRVPALVRLAARVRIFTKLAFEHLSTTVEGAEFLFKQLEVAKKFQDRDTPFGWILDGSRPAHASTANKNSRAGTVVASTSVSAAHAAESSSSALHETDPRARLLCRGAFGGMLAPRPANEEWAAPQPGAGARRVAPAPLRQVWPAAPCPCGRNLLPGPPDGGVRKRRKTAERRPRRRAPALARAAVARRTLRAEACQYTVEEVSVGGCRRRGGWRALRLGGLAAERAEESRRRRPGWTGRRRTPRRARSRTCHPPRPPRASPRSGSPGPARSRAHKHAYVSGGGFSGSRGRGRSEDSACV